MENIYKYNILFDGLFEILCDAKIASIILYIIYWYGMILGKLIKGLFDEIINGEYYTNNSPIGDLVNRENNEIIDEEYHTNNSSIGDLINRENNKIINGVLIHHMEH